jgi:threonine dehydratase
MPASAAQSKIDASRGYGATVLFAESGAAAFARAEQLARDEGSIFVHPFDDAAVIAGAGTVGAELAEQLPELDAVVVPVGGGGLIAGVAVAMRALSPQTRIYGVEPEGAASMHQSVRAGAAVSLSDPPHTIADGLAAPMAGKLNYQVVRDMVDDIVLVSDDAIRTAMHLLITRSKQLTEPAGAAALAALLTGVIPDVGGRNVTAILSGGNVDLERLATM